MGLYFFTSVSISKGHQDKLANQVYDIISDEIKTTANVDYIQVAHDAIYGIDYKDCEVLVANDK